MYNIVSLAFLLVEKNPYVIRNLNKKIGSYLDRAQELMVE